MRRTVAVVVMAWMASMALASSPYFVQMDTVRGSVAPQGAVCVANTVFVPNEQVVFRAYVFDAATGERISADAVADRGVRVTVEIDNGVEVALNYIPHPPGEAPQKDTFWAGGWVVPADAPMGTLTWRLVVTDDAGNRAEFTPIGQAVGLNLLTITQPGG